MLKVINSLDMYPTTALDCVLQELSPFLRKMELKERQIADVEEVALKALTHKKRFVGTALGINLGMTGAFPVYTCLGIAGIAVPGSLLAATFLVSGIACLTLGGTLGGIWGKEKIAKDVAQVYLQNTVSPLRKERLEKRIVKIDKEIAKIGAENSAQIRVLRVVKSSYQRVIAKAVGN